MQIKCPKCSAGFLVKAEQMKPEGRKVRCSECGYVWYQESEHSLEMFSPEATLNKSVDKLSEQNQPYKESNLPVILPREVKKSQNNYLLQLLMLFFIFFLLILSLPRQLGIEQLLNKQLFTLQAIKLQRGATLQENMVTYQLINKSRKIQNFPLVRIKFFDKNKQLIKTLINSRRQKYIKPGDVITIRKQLNFTIDEVSNIELTIGNQFDFFLN